MIQEFLEIEFDPQKSAKNEIERGLPFQITALLEWDKAIVATDDRHDYGEVRYVALVPMHGRLRFVSYCMVARDAGREIRRIISFLTV